MIQVIIVGINLAKFTNGSDCMSVVTLFSRRIKKTAYIAATIDD